MFHILFQVIPAERRGPEKEETWTLAPEPHDPFYDELSDAKPKGPQDADSAKLPEPPAEAVEPSETGTLPRNQESRKSKTRKVKSYLRKCKGALSKGDEASSEKKRQEHCTSWYLEDSQSPFPEETGVLCEKQQESSADRITEVDEVGTVAEEDGVTSSAPDPSKTNEDTPDEALSRLLDEDRKNDLRRSRSSLYEDARDCEQINASAPGKAEDHVSLETLTTEDTNLNKCDSSDTLIAEGGCSTAYGEQADDEEAGNDETQLALSLLGVSGPPFVYPRRANRGITHNARFPVIRRAR